MLDLEQATFRFDDLCRKGNLQFQHGAWVLSDADGKVLFQQSSIRLLLIEIELSAHPSKITEFLRAALKQEGERWCSTYSNLPIRFAKEMLFKILERLDRAAFHDLEVEVKLEAERQELESRMVPCDPNEDPVGAPLGHPSCGGGYRVIRKGIS